VIGAIFVAYGTHLLLKRARQALHAQAKYEEELTQKIEDALTSINNLGFSMCFISFSDMKAMGSLWSHEKARNAGKIHFKDTFDDLTTFVKMNPTVFFSHQWLGLETPDPNIYHYPAMIAAAEALCSQQNIDPNKLFCWIDYLSIPQQNTNIQSQSISSIGIFASVCRYFVAVCPTTQHVDTGLPCDVESYMRRGWCRLEQWARLTIGGLQNMYFYDGAKLMDLAEHPKWHNESIKVFEGNFTDPRDKQKLIPTILGLWATVLRNQRVSNDTVGSYELVKQNYEQVFPQEHFADLLPRLETMVEEEEFNATSRTGTSDTSDTPGEHGQSSAVTRGRSFARKRKDGKLFAAFRAGQSNSVSPLKNSPDFAPTMPLSSLTIKGVDEKTGLQKV